VTAGKIVLVVLGSILGLLGLALMAGGGAALWAKIAVEDEDGFISTGFEQFRSPTYAIGSKGLDVVDLPAGTEHYARVRIRAAPSLPEKRLFVGIGPSDLVRGYLAGVAHDEVDDIDVDPFVPHYDRLPGSAPRRRPGSAGFWVAAASGSGVQTVVWPVERGRWAAVVMNADASRGVAADVSLGGRLSFLLPLAIGLLIGGAVVLTIGVLLIVLGTRRRPRAEPAPISASEASGAGMTPAEPGEGLASGAVVGEGAPSGLTGTAAGPPVPPATYPARLEGRLDEPLSRWLWLVKWLLAIPHYLLLVFLWIAFVVVAVIAFFAILFTARYPRGLFEFNLGVLRWTWRVAFYSYGALATDRYPPFSLGEEPGYPATLYVEYPERLSRGLVLVKWWLLAIPHYLVVGVFVGGWGRWDGSNGGGPYYWGGLITLLAIFAAIGLLFSGRYSRDIFRFVVGMNRWVFRLWAYASLMRDEYPPFRLDP
jgi:hypothetical protein